jgi:hypothetical protein
MRCAAWTGDSFRAAASSKIAVRRASIFVSSRSISSKLAPSSTIASDTAPPPFTT